jgi:hypothetical protein
MMMKCSEYIYFRNYNFCYFFQFQNELDISMFLRGLFESSTTNALVMKTQYSNIQPGKSNINVFPYIEN